MAGAELLCNYSFVLKNISVCILQILIRVLADRVDK
jgi:hypothetical protein